MWWGCECFSFNVTVVVSCRCSCFVVVVVPWFGLCRTKRLRKQQETVTKIKSGKWRKSDHPILRQKIISPIPPYYYLGVPLYSSNVYTLSCRLQRGAWRGPLPRLSLASPSPPIHIIFALHVCIHCRVLVGGKTSGFIYLLFIVV